MAMAETKTTGSRPAALKPTSLNTATAVEMIGVNKWYGEFHVLRDVNLKVSRGEKLVICGPSGSGKSTMIRCINRLEDYQQGRVVVDGVLLTDDLKRIDTVRREVGTLVGREYAEQFVRAIRRQLGETRNEGAINQARQNLLSGAPAPQ